MEGISTRCSFQALFTGPVGLRLAVEGMGVVAASAMLSVAEVSGAHEGSEEGLAPISQPESVSSARGLMVEFMRSHQPRWFRNDCSTARLRSAVVAILCCHANTRSSRGQEESAMSTYREIDRVLISTLSTVREGNDRRGGEGVENWRRQ